MSLIPPNVGPVPPADKVEANELAAAYRNTVIEIQSKLFDRAAAYSNLIMLGGYAGAFTIWANTKAQLSPKANVAVATLLGVSLVVFVLYQVVKMLGHLWHFQRVRRLLSDNLTLPEFFAKYNELQSRDDKTTLQLHTRLAAICFLAIVVPALIGLGILFYSFFVTLLN